MINAISSVYKLGCHMNLIIFFVVSAFESEPCIYYALPLPIELSSKRPYEFDHDTTTSIIM